MTQDHHPPRRHRDGGLPRQPGHRPGDLPPALAEVMAQVVPCGGTFGHRQHIHLAFLAVQRYGAARAAEVVAGWIRHIAAYERAPQKFNATVSRAWTEIVAHHVATGPPGVDFDSFAQRAPALLDKRLLARHYSARVLASAAARTGRVEPDLAPFPW
jgi:hypothetical protein